MAPTRQIKRPRSNTFSGLHLPGLPRRPFARYRHSTGSIPEEDMPLFARTIPALRLSAHPTREDEINAFLSSDVHAELDLEDSFASNMSLNSPPRARPQIGLPDTPDAERDYVPMDISPAPPRVFHSAPPQALKPTAPLRIRKNDRERDTNHTMQLPLPSASANTARTTGRPRSNTGSNARLFGTDVSNANAGKKTDERGSEDKGAAGRKLQRAAIPLEWVTSDRENDSSNQSMDAPSSPDAMDVDSSFSSLSSSAPEATSPISGATITQSSHRHRDAESISGGPKVAQFDDYFYRSASPIGAPDFDEEASASMSAFDEESASCPRKKRSVSPDAPQKRRSRTLQLLEEESTELDSSPAINESPSVHKLERLNSKPAIRALPLPVPNPNTKRARRPVLSEMVAPGAVEGMLRSANPILQSNEETEPLALPPKSKENELLRPRGAHVLPPVRRAVSAMFPANVDPMQSFESDADGSMDAPDMSSPAQAYALRQQVKTIRRRDGTDDFRSVTGATALLQRDSEMRSVRRETKNEGSPVVGERDTPRSKYLNAGPKLGSFGDNEANGKVLPCHRVPADGLMRITAQTLDLLLDGKFDSQIKDFVVIDCRFDYEYNGGHVPGAININTQDGVEEFFLGPRRGKPSPSMSGDNAKKTVLVFHCEFSQQRAPTFAKHLRAKDRIINSEMYPRICYPEVYVLEGGYCEYFKQSGSRCHPPAYVPMDDPKHASSRREDLDQFRKGKHGFGRTKSYAYGEGKGGLLAQPLPGGQPKRNSAPTNGSTTLFAGNVARTRRAQGMLQTLEEDTSGPQATDCEDEDTDIGDSPCPPPTKGVPFKGGKMPRMPIARAETYGPSRFPH